MAVFQGKDHNGNDMIFLYNLGVIYQIIFIIVNVILLFNLVIAILSSTFAFYEQIKLGLYNNVLNSMFSETEWDPYFGALLCLKPPLPNFVLLVPLSPVYFILSSEKLKE
jgi:hypothetical protein